MRNLVVSIHSTFNGVVTGPPDGDETDFGRWAQIGSGMESFLASLDGVDAVLLGRGTYEDLVRKWPNVRRWGRISDVVREIATIINECPKFVVSSTLADEVLPWGAYTPATRIDGAEAIARIGKLKRTKGGDIVTFGSPVLVRSLINAGLVDEFRMIVHPVIMHEGRRLFEDMTVRTNLQLLGVEPFESGAMMVRYTAKRARTVSRPTSKG